MTKLQTPLSNIRTAEAFKLADDCDGVIWQNALGWHGCLRWSVEGNTDFVGPFPSRSEAIREVKDAFLAPFQEETSADT